MTTINPFFIFDDLADGDLIDAARTIEADAKEALRRRDAVRGALLRRMHQKNATVLVDDDGVIAAELAERKAYTWDSDLLLEGVGPAERDKYLKEVPAHWVPKNSLTLNNLIAKLGDDPKGKLLAAARKVEVTESVKLTDYKENE